MVVDVRVEEVCTEGVDQAGAVLRNVRITKMFAHHRAILGFCQRVVVGVPWSRFGELHTKLLQQLGDLVIDVLRAVVRMESQNDKWKLIQQLPDDRKQVRLADLLMERLAI